MARLSIVNQGMLDDALGELAPVASTGNYNDLSNRPISIWAPTTAYVAGQMVVYAGQVYTAIANHTSGATFLSTQWSSINPGELAYAQLVSEFATTSGGVDVTGLSVTVPVGTRPIYLEFEGYMTNTTASAYAIVQINDVTAGGAALVEEAWNHPAGGILKRLRASARVAPAAGSRTYKVTLQAAGGGNAKIVGVTTSPAFLRASQG